MRKPVFVVGLFALTLAVAPACATKKFVRTEVGQVNDKVTTLGKSLEETRAAMDWSAVEPRFTGGDPLLAFLFNIWFKTPIVEAQHNLSTGKDNESLEAPAAPAG